jgi:predicted O-methyltransferase YrrM
MEFARVADAVRGVPYIDEAEGRRLYDHLRATRARDVLELGTAHGASAADMAAALDANGALAQGQASRGTIALAPRPAGMTAPTG